MQGLRFLWTDRRNTTWPARTVRRHGWPGIAAVGAEAAHAAWLLAQHAGRPQLYGTQYDTAGGVFGPRPIEDPSRLHERRAEAGLPPMDEQDARMRRLVRGEGP